MKEITNGMRHDLEMIMCDNLKCQERGDYARCYLDIYKNCKHYERRKYGNNNKRSS